MKQHNMHIPDEDFIPEGLEFREEYMHSALSMYERARKTLLWKKWMYGSIGMGVVLVSAILLLHPREVNETNLVSSPTIKSEINGKASTPNVVTNTTSMSDLSSNDVHVTTADETNSPVTHEMQKNTQEHMASSIQEKSDLIATEKKTSINSSNKRTGKKIKSSSESTSTASGMSNLKPETPILKKTDSSTNPDQLENLISIATTTSNSSEVYTDRILTPMITLNTRNGAFLFGEETLRRAGMPISPVSKWTPFVSIGLNPFTRYGLNYSQLHLNPAISAGMKYSVCSGSTLSTSLEYYSVTDLSHPYAITNSEYGQGSTKTQTTIFTHTLHYAGIHLQHITPFGKRHAVLLGYRGSYLINGQNEISTSTTQNSEALAGSTSKAKGYIDGFRNFNHALSLGYEYKFGANKYLGINYSYGLSDITRDAYFGSRFDRNSMIGLYLKMNIR